MPSVSEIQAVMDGKVVEAVNRWALDLFAVWSEAATVGEVTVFQSLINDGAKSISRRLDSGVDSISWQAYQGGRVEQMSNNGSKFKWVLDAGADHCNTCLTYAGQPAYTLASLPGVPGDAPTDCNGGCRCDLVEVSA